MLRNASGRLGEAWGGLGKAWGMLGECFREASERKLGIHKEKHWKMRAKLPLPRFCNDVNPRPRPRMCPRPKKNIGKCGQNYHFHGSVVMSTRAPARARARARRKPLLMKLATSWPGATRGVLEVFFRGRLGRLADCLVMLRGKLGEAWGMLEEYFGEAWGGNAWECFG